MYEGLSFGFPPFSFQSSLFTDKDKENRLGCANELFAKVSNVKYLFFCVARSQKINKINK